MQAGSHVTLSGLAAKPELNGAKGVLGSFDEESGRWQVKLAAESVKVKPANIAVDEAANAVSKLKLLLENLDPMSMMNEGGPKKATIAIGLLESKAAEMGTALAFTHVPGSVRLLLQTALLHPEARMRLGATTVVLRLVRQNEPAFLAAAHESMLSKALSRMLAESDRRVKAEGEGEEEPELDEEGKPAAVDPDLPKRRVALEVLDALALHTTPDVALQTLSSDDLVYAPLDLLSNSDVFIRRGAAALLHGLLAGGGPAATLVLGSLDEVASDAVALFLKALADVDDEVRASTRQALLLLRPSAQLRAAFAASPYEIAQGGHALRVLATAAAESADAASATAVQQLRELADWAEGVGGGVAPELS